MSTKIVLEIEAGLAPEEVGFVKQLLRDAIGEFITARSGRGSDRRIQDTPDPNDATIEYVRKRYPDLTLDAHLRKVDEVRLRKAVARKLRRAADSVRVEEIVPVAERVCEVLPTYFPQSVEQEAEILAEGIRDAKRDEMSPLTAYAEPPKPLADDFEFDVERFTIPAKRDTDE